MTMRADPFSATHEPHDRGPRLRFDPPLAGESHHAGMIRVPAADDPPPPRPESGPQSDADSPSRSDSVLALFRAWHQANVAHDERRASPRYVPMETRAWAGWWRRGHFVVCRASLVNLSDGGALMLLSRQPPTVQPVWVCLGSSHPAESVQGRVHETRAITAGNSTEFGPGQSPFEASDDATPSDGVVSLTSGPGIAYVTRVEFHAPCPPGFFTAAGKRSTPTPSPG